MEHGQKGLALHSSTFYQEQIVTSESHSELGQNIKWIPSSFACLHPTLHKLVKKSKEKVREAEQLWRKAGTGYCDVSANYHRLAFMFQSCGLR